MKRTLVLAGAAVAAAAIALPAAFASGAVSGRSSIESAKYEVAETFDAFEVRDYAPRLVARVEVEGNPRKASNDGFRILAGFIFGGNESAESVAMTTPVERKSSQKIAMTAPVDRTAAGERWVLTFTMPSAFTMETLPKPNDPRIEVAELPGQRFAAVRFSGAPSDKQFHRRAADLRAAVDDAGLEATDAPPIFSRYDPPWTLPFLRRNEVLVELVAPASDQSISSR